MPKLATVKECTGCGACYNICPHSAIAMKPDSQGFIVPFVERTNCVECKLCERACPIVNAINIKNPPIAEAYAFWDKRTRTLSSSGGAFSSIARWVLNKDGVVFGASWYNGFDCVHTQCESESELHILRGSKYLQSDILKTFAQAREFLRSGRFVLFSGTPCQIAGLKTFLLKPYEKLITVDIVCHGVPSGKLFRTYIDKLIKEYPEYKYANGFGFRKLNGWGIAPSIKFPKSKESMLTGVKNIYMDAFNKASIFRDSCYNCHFNGLSRTGDITIADFWGIGESKTPFKHNVSKGVSLLLINSDKGKTICNELTNCFIAKRDIQEALNRNHNLTHSSKKSENRDEIIDSFMNPQMTLKMIDDKFHLSNKTIKGRVIDILVKTNLFWSMKAVFNKLKTI